MPTAIQTEAYLTLQVFMKYISFVHKFACCAMGFLLSFNTKQPSRKRRIMAPYWEPKIFPLLFCARSTKASKQASMSFVLTSNNYFPIFSVILLYENELEYLTKINDLILFVRYFKFICWIKYKNCYIVFLLKIKLINPKMLLICL